MPGFEVVEARMPKCGIRGTATARLAFRDMPCRWRTCSARCGKGLRVALTVLDFGRTTFGASCTGVAKTAASRRRARQPARQFKQTLGEFELVKKKIADMAAHAFAMEATTAECAASSSTAALEDYMLETAMLKVLSTERFGKRQRHPADPRRPGLLHRPPLERMMRDARINMIGEGANDVLTAFIAVVGMRGPGWSSRRSSTRC